MNKKKVYGGFTVEDIDKRVQERFWWFLISTVREEAKDEVTKGIDEHLSKNHPFYYNLPYRLTYYVASSRYSRVAPGDSLFMNWLMDKDAELYYLVKEAKEDGYEFSIKL